MAKLFEQRRQKKEIEREIKFKQGLSKVRSYVQQCNQSQKKYWELGKRSLKLGDRQQFDNIAKAYLRTIDMANRWERYLVAMETTSLQRDQVKATGAFAQSMKALSESMMAGANPDEVTKMQIELERALTKAQTLDQTLSAIMDTTSTTIFSGDGLSEDTLKEIETAMSGEAAQDESTAVKDDRISEGLRRIEEEMNKELR